MKIAKILVATLATFISTAPADGLIEMKPLPGVTAADIQPRLEKQGFTVTPATEGDYTTWNGKLDRGGYQYRITFSGPNPSQIAAISATITGTQNIPAAAAEFFGFVATLPITGIDPEKAKAWAKANTETQRASIESSGIHYLIVGNAPFARAFRIAVKTDS